MSFAHGLDPEYPTKKNSHLQFNLDYSQAKNKHLMPLKKMYLRA